MRWLSLSRTAPLSHSSSVFTLPLPPSPSVSLFLYLTIVRYCLSFLPPSPSVSLFLYLTIVRYCLSFPYILVYASHSAFPHPFTVSFSLPYSSSLSLVVPLTPLVCCLSSLDAMLPPSLIVSLTHCLSRSSAYAMALSHSATSLTHTLVRSLSLPFVLCVLSHSLALLLRFTDSFSLI